MENTPIVRGGGKLRKTIGTTTETAFKFGGKTLLIRLPQRIKSGGSL